MSFVIALDSGPLSLITHRKGAHEADLCRQWLKERDAKGDLFVIPEIADYEVRRELLRAGKTASIARLDLAIQAPNTIYIPLTTSAMRLAAKLWADIRRRGLPTSDRHSLDADVILAAQLLDADYGPPALIVATTNVDHLSRFVPAMAWEQIR